MTKSKNSSKLADEHLIALKQQNYLLCELVSLMTTHFTRLPGYNIVHHTTIRDKIFAIVDAIGKKNEDGID